MNQRIQRFAQKLRLLERKRYALAHGLEAAEHEGNVSKLLRLEDQYREVVEAMGRMRRVLRALRPARAR
jgi:hypothetical protein